MKKQISSVLLLCLIFLFASCSETTNRADNDNNEIQETTSGPELSPVTCRGIPAGFHCDDYVIADRALYIHGTDSSGPSFFCVDLETDEKTDIKLPVSGAVMDLSVSNRGTCLATVYSSRTDETGTPRGCFTLFEINPDAVIGKQTELTGIDDINLLAIGTPVVNGCAVLDDSILIIVNNRVILLDNEGKLLDYVIMDSGYPRIAGASIQPVCIFDAADGELTAKLLYVSQDNEISVKPMECPPSCLAIIPTADRDSVFVVQDKTVYSFDPEDQNKPMRPVWSFPYGFSSEKAYYYDGEEALIECYNGNIALYRIQ